ncbi:MAG: glycogen debranching protein [Bacteroidales bacterium]|nr:glycogen debranching protein [Bacteroidales bacterium]
MKATRSLPVIAGVLAILSGTSCHSRQPIYSTDAYSLFPDRVVEGDFTARAVSATCIESNYRSKSLYFKSPLIQFKFCINARDNESASGVDHQYLCLAPDGASLELPLIRFGVQLKTEPGLSDQGRTMPRNVNVKFRVDMSDMHKAFEKEGFYDTPARSRIYKEDFKGVYVAGNCDPLSWDFDNLDQREDLKLNLSSEDPYIYEIEMVLNAVEESFNQVNKWTATSDLSDYPRLESELLLESALYNMSLEEMVNAIEPDSTLRTGKEWAGVWTRDVSYSIILAMAHLQPQVSKISLMRKVDTLGRIIQDTGTGGAWPVSTDRMIWAVAAYEIYKVTGDSLWLETIYPIIHRSVDDDLLTVFNPQTGLMKGESSFLDWREQEYPRWMQPADIFQSENLGTNAVHYEAISVLAKICSLLGNLDEALRYEDIARQIAAGINNHLWMEDRGYYGQYLYGRNSMILSPRSETLGEALCILFGIAPEERATRITASVPNQTYGTSCFFPQIPDIPPYHNDAIWPFVQAYWMWASAETGNEKGVLHSIGSIYRAAALFLTNYENMVVENGDWFGTQINSSNMLWSLSGNLSIVYHLLFGIRFEENGLRFKPFVPQTMEGKRSLGGFRYRNAVLDIEMEGYGNKIHSVSLDGKKLDDPFIPADLTGKHTLRLVLRSKSTGPSQITLAENAYSPSTPDISLQNESSYNLWVNGQRTDTLLPVNGYEGDIQVTVVNEEGLESFASEPLEQYGWCRIFETENYAPSSSKPYRGFSGSGFVEINTVENVRISIPVVIEQSGLYLIDWRYANGNGPVNTSNKCAVRTLLVDGKHTGTHVFPQRGNELWNEWGWTNTLQVYLTAGEHRLTLSFLPHNHNMNILVNQAMVDALRIKRLLSVVFAGRQPKMFLKTDREMG